MPGRAENTDNDSSPSQIVWARHEVLQTVARHGITSRISPSGISRPTEAEETAPEDRHGRDQDSEQDEQDFFMRSSLSSQPSAPMRAGNAAWLAQLCLGRRWGRGEAVVSTEG